MPLFSIGQHAAVAAFILGPIQRQVGAFEYGFNAVLSTELGNTTGYRDTDILAAEVEATGFDGLPQ